MITKKIFIDFFGVKIEPDQNVRLESLLSEIFKKPSHERITKKERWFLNEYNEDKRYCCGEMIKIRMDVLPRKITLTGTISSLNLSPNEGIAESNAFIYDKKNRIIAYQRNRYGAGAVAFCNYIHAIFHPNENSVELLPILKSDTYERFIDVQDIKKVNIKVAGLTTLRHFKTSPVENAIIAGKEFGAQEILVEFSMGRKRGGLNFSKVKELVLKVLKVTGDSTTSTDVRRAEVIGFNEAGEKQIIDLIENKVVESADIQVLDRHFPYHQRITAIKNALANQHNELTKFAYRDNDES